MVDEPALPPAEPPSEGEEISPPPPAPDSSPPEPDPAPASAPPPTAAAPAELPPAEPPSESSVTRVAPAEAPAKPPAPAARDEPSPRVRITWSDANRKNAAAEHTRRKEARLESIVQLTRTRGRLTKKGIVIKIHVSDASASRYVRLLVERGVLKREGRGRGVSYVPS